MIYPKSAQPQMNSMHHNFNYGILHVQAAHTPLQETIQMSYMSQMFVSKCIMTIMKCSCTTAIHKGINLNESELCYIQYHLKGGIHNDTHMYLYKQTNMNRHKL